ncbi:MAG: hypothetical protein ACT4OF_04805 [Caulobacteraceae bacterium]
MMRQAALAAMLTFAACNQGSGPPLPELQPGAQAPSRQTPVSAPQADLSEDEREQLNMLVGGRLHEGYRVWAPGFTQVDAGEAIAPLQPGTDHRLNVNLVRGVSYRIVSACDNECDDLDLELIDVSTGGVVADDLRTDTAHRPILDYTPSNDGRYIVRILLQGCSVGPCYVGALLLSFDPRPPAVENIALPSSAARDMPSGGAFVEELTLDPIFDYLRERYDRGFNNYVDLASSVRAGEDFRADVYADGREPYAFIGACDGCGNLDLELSDKATGVVIASDALSNNYPVVYHLTAADTVYVVRLTHDCADACLIGVRALWGDTTLERQ